MEQVYRIEIPVEVVDKTDSAALQRLESALQKVFTSLKQDAKKVEDSADGVVEAFDDAATAAKGAGQKSGSAFDNASTSADKFTKRMEKSNKTMRDAFKEKLQLTIQALDKASPVLKTISTTVKSLGSKAWTVAVKMKDLVTAPFRKLWNVISSPITMALSVAGLGFSATDLLDTFNEFEVGMSGVQALTGATNAEFLLLKETAKDLGASTSFSASQAAIGMQNLASAGFSVEEIIAAMPGMLDLAASSGEDLAVASDIAASTLRGFGLAAEGATHVADVLAATAAYTNASVADTGQAMKYIAPIANTMGLSLEEVAAAIGLLSDAGIKGSQAGTTLRGALSRLAKPTEDMLEVMHGLNLSFYDEQGQMKSISSIVGMLKNNMSDLTDEQKQHALVTLFGQEALSGMMVLLEAGPEKLDTLTQSLENCDGAASEMAQVRLDNLAGDLEALGGALETAKLALMDKLNPYLRSGVQWLTTQIPQVQSMAEGMVDAAIGKFQSLVDFFQSDDFQGADGFAEKLFVSWDKIIVEPFNTWWNSGGKEETLEILSTVGSSIGEVLNGVFTGVFAAISGKDIDSSEGMQLTGFAKAGFDSAKAFVSSFIEGFDVGDLINKMPNMLKLGFLGYGASKLAEAAGGYDVIKTALAAIPPAAWPAVAAIAAVSAAAIAFVEAEQARQEELIGLGDTVEKTTSAYQQTAQQVNAILADLSSISDREEILARISTYSSETVDHRALEAAAIEGNIGLLREQLEVEKQIAAVQQKKALENLENRMPEVIQEERASLAKEASIQADIDSLNNNLEPILQLQTEYSALEDQRLALKGTDGYEEFMRGEGGYYDQAIAMFGRYQRMFSGQENMSDREIYSILTGLAGAGFEESMLSLDNLLGGDTAFFDMLRALPADDQRLLEERMSALEAQQQETAKWSDVRMQYYHGKESALTGEYFEGTQYEGMSLADIAADYNSIANNPEMLAAFEGAIEAMDTMTSTLIEKGWLTNDEAAGEKSKLIEAQQASIEQAIQNIQQLDTKIAEQQQAIAEKQAELASADYSGSAEQLAADQAALAAMSEELELLEANRLEMLTQATTSAETLQKQINTTGGSVTDLSTKVSSLQSQLSALAGEYEVRIKYVTSRTSFATTSSGPKIERMAEGGIYDGARLSWVAEDGPEAIIPLGAKRRDRGLDLWMQAGRMLGVNEFADGGILAPYAGSFAAFSDDDYGSAAAPAFGGGSTIQVNVEVNPSYEISGSDDPEAVLAIIRSKQDELAELFGAAMAEKLEEIVENIV